MVYVKEKIKKKRYIGQKREEKNIKRNVTKDKKRGERKKE
jgi:hypothetical protein